VARAQRTADSLDDIHGALARVGEQHAVDARDVDAFGQASGVGDERALSLGEGLYDVRPGAGRGLAGDVESV
jgi:hypothetical protein